jgi:hypothetical protein
MDLSYDERKVQVVTCSSCGETYERSVGLLNNENDAYAVYYADCHGHPEHEAQIDVILGTWGESDFSDHITFSCTLRSDGARAQDAPLATRPGELNGACLTREAALAHPRVAEFWLVIDFVSEHDETVVANVLGPGADAYLPRPGQPE